MRTHCSEFTNSGIIVDIAMSASARTFTVGRPTYKSLFRRDEDDAVGSAYTVYGWNRSIFEDRERFGVIGIHKVDITFDAIDQYQRSYRPRERGDAADIKVGGAVLTGFARTRHRNYIG